LQFKTVCKDDCGCIPALKQRKGDITCQHIDSGDVLLSNVIFLYLLF